MTFIHRWGCLASLALACACSPVTKPTASAPAPTVTDGEPSAVRAQAAMSAFGGRLKSELAAAIQRDGPLEAIDFCHVQAPRIADQVMAEHGVRLGRAAVAGRNRNPENVAVGWQAEALESFQVAVDAGAAPEAQVRMLRDGLPAGIELRVARGIRVEPACLMCHGASVAPALAARIAQRYPGDRAVGFSEGDLRGAIWAEVPGTPKVTQ